MFIELKPNEFYKATSLFQDVDYSLSLPATFAGNNPGRIFVDDPENPRMAFAMTVEGYFLVGDPDELINEELAGKFLREDIFSGEIYLDDDSNLSLAVSPAKWEYLLSEMIPTHEMIKLPRYQYLCEEMIFNWCDNLPDGYLVCNFNQEILENSTLIIPEEILDWTCIEVRWGSLENFYTHGISSCVIHKNKVVAICSPDCYAGDRIDIGIYTIPKYRKKGLASIATAATVETAFQRGYKKVGWHCNQDNIGSWKTAEKVGFKRLNTYSYYFYIFDEIDHLASLGWFYFKRNQYKQTADYYERVFAARDENPDYFYHLAALAWAALGDKGQAIKYLNAAVDHGWRARDWTEQEDKFKILHNIPEWKVILRRMST